MWDILYRIENYLSYLYIRFRGFLPEDAIVQDLCDNLSEEYEEIFRNIKYQDLILLHSSVGRYIRNKYGLWYVDNPHTNYELPDNYNHPDEMSFRIIQKVWKLINDDH